MTYEELIEEKTNSFSQVVQYIEKIINLTRQYPHLKYFCKETVQYNTSSKTESQFIEYQHTESMVDRVLFADRKHPLDIVKINEFNKTTDSSLENVNIIYGPSADEFTRSHHALALAVADTIYFRNGAYKPETEEGQKLLTHELTHVKQFKEKELIDTKSKKEKEAEAEYNESQKEYNPDEKIRWKIENTEYLFTRSEWRKIQLAVENDIQEWIENEKNYLTEEEYLKLLCNYKKWEGQGNRIWQ